ncbi:MAG: VTT domain-containing protein [Candidatus Korobacteraceae bacterium]|jgi:membrane protein DedA with SNARE-associated domain
MGGLLSRIAQHGYILISSIIFAGSLGVPVPATLTLVGSGAATASGALNLPAAFLVALATMLLGDSLLFILGRYMGWGLLGLMCKLSRNPETCILRSAKSFYKRGRTTLLFAKFIPGVSAMIPPLAGSMKMPFAQFVALDLIGTSLWILAYGGLGFLFHDFIVALTHGFRVASHAVGIVLATAIGAFVVRRILLYRKQRIYRAVPRVQVDELANRLHSEGADKVLLVDVRSHGYYDSGAERIQGSIRIEPNNLDEEINRLDHDKDIYLYCT